MRAWAKQEVEQVRRIPTQESDHSLNTDFS
jgi:hypothetical protein